MSSMGECPCCKTRNLNYGALELENESCFFPRTCGTCGAEGLERYILEYDCQELTEEGNLSTNQEEDDRIENWKDDLFDDLNNILFEKHSELTEYIKKWLIEHKLVDDDRIVGELASDFIDQKELYDLDYED